MLAVAGRLVVVLGAHLERVRAAVPDDLRIATAYNPNYERGQLSSLKIGLGEVGADDEGGDRASGGSSAGQCGDFSCSSGRI